MAQLAGETLIALLAGEKPKLSSIVLPCGFDVRDSTTIPRGAS
jgi:DNA-binding LacI/PurR family transcriptional regulator